MQRRIRQKKERKKRERERERERQAGGHESQQQFDVRRKKKEGVKV